MVADQSAKLKESQEAATKAQSDLATIKASKEEVDADTASDESKAQAALGKATKDQAEIQGKVTAMESSIDGGYGKLQDGIEKAKKAKAACEKEKVKSVAATASFKGEHEESMSDLSNMHVGDVKAQADNYAKQAEEISSDIIKTNSDIELEKINDDKCAQDKATTQTTSVKVSQKIKALSDQILDKKSVVKDEKAQAMKYMGEMYELAVAVNAKVKDLQESMHDAVEELDKIADA